MAEDRRKVVGIFLASKVQDKRADLQQALLRECATKYCLNIVSFVALPKTSLFEGLKQIIGIASSKNAHAFLIDEKDTLFLSGVELKNFFELLYKHKISIIAARSGLILGPHHVAVFADFLQTSAQAEHERHGQVIKRSLRLKKRQGIKLGGKKFAEAEIIEQIMDLHRQKKSLHEICVILTMNDVKSTHNKKWYATTIKRIIDRENKINKI